MKGVPITWITSRNCGEPTYFKVWKVAVHKWNPLQLDAQIQIDTEKRHDFLTVRVRVTADGWSEVVSARAQKGREVSLGLIDEDVAQAVQWHWEDEQMGMAVAQYAQARGL